VRRRLVLVLIALAAVVVTGAMLTANHGTA
jgi:hypothetical protein